MSRYLIDGVEYGDNDDGLQTALASIHQSRIRPKCLCRGRPGVPMYVAKIAGHYYIKRMPETGAEHMPGKCASYETPPEASGRAEVIGHAIKEDVEDGITTLRLDFPLRKMSGRIPPDIGDAEQTSAKADASKLSIRAVLHYLWDEAKLTYWHPHIEGKRSWGTVYKRLIQAGQGKVTKGLDLSKILYIPEPFYPDRKAEIKHHRDTLILQREQQSKQGQQLYIVIGEIKAVPAAPGGHRLILKHAPDFGFILGEALNKRLKIFANELAFWHSDASGREHLVSIATFSVNSAGLATLEEMALMHTNEHWIPYSTVDERDLIASLISDKRHFVKCLRYNKPSNRPIASVLLHDCGEKPVAMYLVPANAKDDYMTALEEMTSSEKMLHWIWTHGDIQPSIPDRVRSGVSDESNLANFDDTLIPLSAYEDPFSGSNRTDQ